mmetsp:Transcript_25175/g.64399  ORF Transcript_25175/g.64399 Transcript_25175/m.64399 type:complete len:165 (-) Transcript_25175:455-949(-)
MQGGTATEVEDASITYDKFLEDVLKKDLQKLIEQHQEALAQVDEAHRLVANLEALIDDGTTELETMMNLGCDFYAQAYVEDCTKVFVEAGLGFFVEMPLKEATKFVYKRIQFLESVAQHREVKVAKQKATVHMFLDALGQLQATKMGLPEVAPYDRQSEFPRQF